MDKNTLTLMYIVHGMNKRIEKLCHDTARITEEKVPRSLVENFLDDITEIIREHTGDIVEEE